ncbi:MAG: restriction endonuclease subunit S [Acidobacteria bacterium]|nr:restriction endonuclease subunit S [Acidobacteriota bacterium]
MIGQEGTLPQGWVKVPVRELVELNPKHNSDVPDNTSVSFIPMSAVDDVEGVIREHNSKQLGTIRKGYTHFADEDVIFAKITPCMENGKSAVARALVNGLACGSTEFFVLRGNGAIDPHYLHKFVRQESYRSAAKRAMSGAVGQARVTKEFILNTDIPLPPINEQRRIVANLELMLDRVTACRKRLEQVPRLLKQFRQSILAAACSGRLTSDWRVEHPNIVSASTLMEQVRVERRHRWEEIELTKMRAKGKKPANERWKQKYLEPEKVNQTEQPKLPQGWCWEQIALLGNDPLNAVQTGPFGAQLHNTEFVDSGVPVIAVGNLTGLGFTSSGLYHITEKKAKQLSRYDVWAGDVLFARSGATLGKVCVAPPEVQDWRMTGHILRLRLNTRIVLPEFVAYSLWGDLAVKEQVVDGIRGMTRPGYNTSLLERILIPIPPMPEQERIVDIVKSVLQTIRHIADESTAADKGFNTLSQAILAKAFRGELVAQDPDDEPASVLLERIKAEKAETGKPEKKKNKRPPVPKSKTATRRSALF